MLAILYLAGMIYFGDRVCRYFFRFSSIQHRLATSFLVGLVLSSCITYLGSLAFAFTSQPLIWGNLIFLGLLIATFKLPRRMPSVYLNSVSLRPTGSGKWDWLCLGVCFFFGCWLMFATLNFWHGSFLIRFAGWTDFGANLSLAQSLAVGHNFPTEHPFFPGEPVRYHFLFWFQTANLSYLGFNLVWSVNLLSLFSLMALLILIMTFAELLFGSRIVGRIAAILFFFASSSLSYIPFLASKPSLRNTVGSILRSTQFLDSGYPFRGENWGALSVDVFINQRHLISSVGILFVVLVFLVDFYRHKKSIQNLEVLNTNKERRFQLPKDFRGDIWALLFCGVLIGALPYWNGAIFVSALIILGGLFLLFPYRLYTVSLIGTAVVVGLPQVLMLKSGNWDQTRQSLFRLGYTIADPTVWKILDYLAWTFGFKWILIFIALRFLSKDHRRFFLAVSILLPVVFLLQLSVDAFNNHKLLNVWGIFASIYAAYAAWQIGKAGVRQAVLASVLVLATIFGAIIDLFPVYNDPKLVVPYKNDRLTTWVFENTKTSDVFLTQALLTHPILFAGRKIFMGNQLFAWTAGYNLVEREAKYKQMFEEQNPDELLRLLRANNIAYVGIDDGVRGNNLVKDNLNQAVFEQNFEKVFEDTEERYAHLTIYKVP